MVLLYTPEVELVTLRETVQFEAVETEPPESETLPEPAVAVAVPPHELVRPLGVATTRPVGSESVKATPVSPVVFAEGLVMVRVRDVTPLGAMLEAPKDLTIDGGATTVRLAVLLVAPVPPSVEVTVPVVSLCVPAAIPVT